MDNIFTISFNDFKISTIIGILPKEREQMQDIILDVDISYTNNEILDYTNLHNLIMDIFDKNHFLYLEDALCFVIDSIILHFDSIRHIYLSIKKPDIFPNCVVGVSKKITSKEITRRKIIKKSQGYCDD